MVFDRGSLRDTGNVRNLKRTRMKVNAFTSTPSALVILMYGQNALGTGGFSGSSWTYFYECAHYIMVIYTNVFPACMLLGASRSLFTTKLSPKASQTRVGRSRATRTHSTIEFHRVHLGFVPEALRRQCLLSYLLEMHCHGSSRVFF